MEILHQKTTVVFASSFKRPGGMYWHYTRQGVINAHALEPTFQEKSAGKACMKFPSMMAVPSKVKYEK